MPPWSPALLSTAKELRRTAISNPVDVIPQACRVYCRATRKGEFANQEHADVVDGDDWGRQRRLLRSLGPREDCHQGVESGAADDV
jgi:hypothetical protein